MQRLVLVSKKIIALVCFIVFISGCSQSFTSFEKEEKIPSWYLNAPMNSTVFIYGTGTATSIENAKDNGLNDMAARLVVSVGSTTSSITKTSLDNNSSSYSKNVSKDIKVDVEKIKFTNAVTEKSEHIQDNFYVLMKVDREKLFDNKKKEFDINDKRIMTIIASLEKYAKLEKIIILQDTYPMIIQAKKEAIILNAIKNSFDQSPYIEKYDSYIDMINELKNNSSIMVKTNNQKGYFADSLTNMLNQNQYKVSMNNKSDVIISLNNKVKYSIAKSWNIAKVSTTISVISNNKIISNTIISSIGRSSTSQESALENASQNFVDQIKEKTLDKVIFSK